MFRDLDLTLKHILDSADDAELKNAGATFDTPDRTHTNAQGKINLFLYDIRENLPLRDAVPVTVRRGDTFERQRPPLRIDCTYVVTAWEDPAEDGHHLLALALTWLSRFTTIPVGMLQGGLQQAVTHPIAGNPPIPLPTMVAQMDGSKNSVGEFWSALGIAPRPYFNLIVTIPLDYPQPSDGPLVTTKIIGAEPRPSGLEDMLHAIGGRVLDTSGEPIGDAVVDIVEVAPSGETRTRFRTTTISRDADVPADAAIPRDAVGRFVFAQIPTGNQTFRVTAVGFQQASEVISITGRSEDYVIQLTPL